MSLETPRHGVQLELSRAWLVQFAEHLVFPDHSRRTDTNGGLVPDCFVAIRRLERSIAIHCHVPGDGRNPRHACLPARPGAARLALAPLAPASDLLPGAELLHLDGHPAAD